MPELPEVETIVREMREADLIGLTIEEALVFWDRSIANQTASSFCHRMAGQSILDIGRRGKFIVFSLSDDTLLVHLRMTGKFLIADRGAVVSSHERVRLLLSDKRVLRYEDQRKFGKWYLGSAENALEKIGVEPLSADFTLKAFKELLHGKRNRIKPFLLDQRFVAGLGNIYVDEALWASRIHPARSIDTLKEKEISGLHAAIIEVLRKGVANIGTSLGSTRANYFSVSGRRGGNQYQLNVFRRDGLPCPRCGTMIEKIVLAQRGTHFCPLCQKN